jgi:hypothetical protein
MTTPLKVYIKNFDFSRKSHQHFHELKKRTMDVNSLPLADSFYTSANVEPPLSQYSHSSGCLSYNSLMYRNIHENYRWKWQLNLKWSWSWLQLGLKLKAPHLPANFSEWSFKKLFSKLGQVCLSTPQSDFIILWWCLCRDACLLSFTQCWILIGRWLEEKTWRQIDE